jgi:NitT/TauT family transport system permease protein
VEPRSPGWTRWNRRPPARPVPRRAAVASAWPKLAALALAIGVWQAFVSAGAKPDYVLPGPVAVGAGCGAGAPPDLWQGIALTGRRALVGYAAAVAVGLLLDCGRPGPGARAALAR